MSLKEKIVSNILVSDFYEEHLGPELTFTQNMLCPFPEHNDTNESFRVQEDGSFKCFGCNKSGSNVTQFYSDLKGISWKKALKELAQRYVTKVDQKVFEKKIQNFAEALKKDEAFSRFLSVHRGWSEDIMDHFNIGLYEKSGVKWATIPIIDEYGYWKSLLFYNVMKAPDQPKFFYDSDGDNSASIFGLECFVTSKKIYFFEGLPDCLLALSKGLPAVTFGAAGNWKDGWKHYIRQTDGIICYDNDDAGKKGASYLSAQLVLFASSAKLVTFPKGLDFSDYLANTQYDLAYFNDLVDTTDYFKLQAASLPSKNDGRDEEIVLTTLREASKAENYGKRLRIVALVSGKEPSPMLLPRKLMFTCRDVQTKAKCAACTLAQSPTFAQVFDIDEYFKDLLNWLSAGTKDHTKIYRQSLGINSRCKVDLEVSKMWNIEKVILNSPIKHGKLDELPERRLAFYLGYGLIPNKHYMLDCYTLQHPIDNSAVHVITHAEPLDTELENFKTTPEIAIDLRSFEVMKGNIHNKLSSMYDVLSKNVTRIWGREQLHIALDLPFFSPNQFIFDNELVKKASLDILVYGDQRCGKGKIAEGFSDYYRFAEVLSGENISFMNLVGGIESNDHYRGLKWGRLVANNRGIVIIDEASALETKTISRLSRIRSEGIAELDKFGIHAKATAGCSLVWIANTRNDPLSNFSFGVEALRELIGANEDIARFDYAVAVRANEVKASLINRSVKTVDDNFGSNLHRTLILWCKTRTAEQVIFEPGAIKAAFAAAQRLGNKYSNTIPLLQAENARIKIAKIAAAVAGRTFSSDAGGENLLVQLRHVAFAETFLEEIYDSKIIGYNDYSMMEKLSGKVSTEQLDMIFEPLREMNMMQIFINGMLQRKEFQVQDIADLSGQTFYDAKLLISSLVRVNAIKKGKGAWYVKTTPFIDYLKERFNS